MAGVERNPRGQSGNMTIPGTTERYFVQRLHIVTGIGEPIKNWITSNETHQMTIDQALAIAGDDEGNRVIHEVTTRTIVPKGHKYGRDNPHPCHQ